MLLLGVWLSILDRLSTSACTSIGPACLHQPAQLLCFDRSLLLWPLNSAVKCGASNTAPSCLFQASTARDHHRFGLHRGLLSTARSWDCIQRGRNGTNNNLKGTQAAFEAAQQNQQTPAQGTNARSCIAAKRGAAKRGSQPKEESQCVFFHS